VVKTLENGWMTGCMFFLWIWCFSLFRCNS